MFRRQHSSVLPNTQRFPERTHFLSVSLHLLIIQSNADNIPPFFILSDMCCCMIAGLESSVFGFQFLGHLCKQERKSKQERTLRGSICAGTN